MNMVYGDTRVSKLSPTPYPDITHKVLQPFVHIIPFASQRDNLSQFLKSRAVILDLDHFLLK